MTIYLQRIARKNFFIKFRHWEYWPFGILQLPVLLYYLWLSLKARSFFFFAASNPGIEMGGLLGESKFSILEKIPSIYRANTFFITGNTSFEKVQHLIVEEKLSFPLIFKPDLGERGYQVKRVNSVAEVQHYCTTFHHDFLIQELIELPLEFGVFYKRLPSQHTGLVFSIVGKEMLTVTGNGRDTLEQLILDKDRAKLQWQRLKHQHAASLCHVIPAGQNFVLNSIGNHCLGTTFLNCNSLINPTLTSSFDAISKQIDGFFYGRFDLRCSSIDDLTKGNVKILELNGCGAEPAHIYQPGYSFYRAVIEMIDHWRNIYTIAVENKKHGIKFISCKDAYFYYKKFKLATST